MKTYKLEQSIKNEILANRAFDMQVLSYPKSKGNSVVANIVDNPHEDMMYGSAILTSTVMNLNDDVLLPKHIWPALDTIISTPYNNQHKKKDIIGHIINKRVLDENGDVVDEDGTPPDYFDIEVDFVVYKSIFPEIAEEIAEGFESQTKFVSLEGEISDFDYALIDASGSMKVVARTDETSFLTKRLRIYGGSGKWNGYTLGRVLKDFRFTGMGNVDNPANPGSVYTRIENFDFIEPEEILSQRRNHMFETLEEALEHISKVEAEKTTLEERISALEKESEEKTKLNEKTLAERLEIEKNKVKVAEKTANEHLEASKKLEEELKTVKASLQEKEEEIAKIQAEQALAERLATLDELGVSYEDDEKESLASMSEDGFNEIVKYAKRAIEAAKTGEEDKEDKDEEVEDIEAEESKDNADVTTDEGDVVDEVEHQRVIAGKLISAIRKK